MKTLNLTLKKKWFDMIVSGKKTEEYREIKPHWISRLEDKKYDAVKFTNGYGKHRPNITFELLSIIKSDGHAKWGATPKVIYYVLKLGKPFKV